MLEGMKFYKYCKVNQHTYKMLITKRLYAPHPSDLNDPLDCEIELADFSQEEAKEFLIIGGKKRGIPEEVIRSNLQSYLEKNGDLKQEAMDDFKNALSKAVESLRNYGIICFSEKPDDILMWSHYANNHKGICLEFTAEKGSELANPQLNQKVEYLDEYPKLKITDFVNDDPTIASKKAMWSKAKIWEYEQEWRMINQEGGRTFGFPGRLSGIIFGLKCDPTHIRVVKAFARHIGGIEYKKVHQKERRFELEIRPL